MSTEFQIGDKAKEYIITMMGECIGCIEIEVAQDLRGNKIKVVTDSHGGAGFIGNGATAPLNDRAHTDAVCTKEPHQRRSEETCSRCWMKDRTNG